MQHTGSMNAWKYKFGAFTVQKQKEKVMKIYDQERMQRSIERYLPNYQSGADPLKEDFGVWL